MPKYIRKLLDRLKHPSPTKPEYSPHKHIAIKYTKKEERRLTNVLDCTPFLDKKQTKRIQSIVGAL